MRLGLFFIFILFSMIAFSQDSSKYSKFSVSLDYTPNYTYRTVKVVAGQALGPRHYKTSDQLSGFGFSGSLQVGYNFHNVVQLKTGLIYDKYEYNTKEIIDTFYNNQHYIADIKKYKYKIHYILIGVPLRIQKEIKLVKNLYGCLGVGLNYYFLGSSENSYRPNNANSFGFGSAISLNGNIGINIKFQNISLIIAPSYNHLLTYTYDDDTWEGETNKLFLYSLGVEFGINYTFSKKKKEK